MPLILFDIGFRQLLFFYKKSMKKWHKRQTAMQGGKPAAAKRGRRARGYWTLLPV
jgi:hypothetical protein